MIRFEKSVDCFANLFSMLVGHSIHHTFSSVFLEPRELLVILFASGGDFFLQLPRRGGIKTVIIPRENERDLKEVPDNIKEHLEIRAVKWIDEVLAIALESMPEPLSDEEYFAESVPAAADGEDDEKNRINTH